MGNPLKALRRLDQWLIERRLRWTTGFLLFAVLAVLGTASLAIEGGHAVLVLAPAFLAFVHRYIRPNV
jgi:hypothetical protein